MLNGFYIEIPFNKKNCINYKDRGVGIHIPPLDSKFSETTSYKFAEFVDRTTGKTTDIFYGSCNDFELYFLGKAARKESFDIISSYRLEEEGRVDMVFTGIGTFDQNPDGTWFPAELEPILPLSSTEYRFANRLYEMSLRQSGKNDEADAIINKSLKYYRS